MKPIREQLKELVKRHGRRVDEVFEAYAARMEQGMTPQAAFESIRDELATLPEQVGVAARDQVPGRQYKEILLPVEETKFEEFAIGVHPVKIADVLVDESETGNVDREGKPEMRRYVRIIFEDAKGVHMTGFASAKVSTRSKLFDWIKKITGQVPEIGKVYNVSSLVGRKCRVYVQETTDETGQRRRKIGDVLPVE